MSDAQAKPVAVVLLSGGLDSATVLAMAKAVGFNVHALSFDYGQRHLSELEAAKYLAGSMEVSAHHVVKLGLQLDSALTNSELEVPKDTVPGQGPIPPTYVPARNTIFLSVALGVAESVGATDIFFGANAVDYSGYPDCRPVYVQAFEQLANLATAASVEGSIRYRVHTPLMRMGKADIIKKAVSLGVELSKTHSCYDPQDGKACGFCEACKLRKEGFKAAGIEDPTVYAD